MLFKNANVFVDGRFQHGAFRVENGRFTEVLDTVPAEDGVDLENQYVIPGLVDVHNHGNSGADFSDGDYDGLVKMARYLAQNGVTSFAPASMTLPYDVLEAAYKTAVRLKKEQPEDCARLMGIQMEGPFFSEKKKGAQNSAYLREPDFAAFKRLYDVSEGLIRIADVAAELPGAVEFTGTEDAQRLFDVNFFGMIRMNRAVLPIMRQQGGGRIVNLSSVAAPVPIPFQTYYSAGKAAVNSYTMALSNEVKPFGITVAAIMPGDIKTGFTAARQKNIIGDDIYGGRISRSVAGMEKDEQTGMDPAAAGRFIANVALKNSRKPLYTIGLAYKGAVFLTKILPARWLNGLIGMIYAK